MSEYTVVCNVVDPRCSYISDGAKAYVSTWANGPYIKIWARTKSGRYVAKWVEIRRVDTFRAKWLAKKQPDFSNYTDLDPCVQCDTKADAIDIAAMLTLKRFEVAPPPQG
jgi:hypothetical protein